MHLLRAPNMAVAALMRFSTSASDVNELVIIEPRYQDKIVPCFRFRTTFVVSDKTLPQFSKLCRRVLHAFRVQIFAGGHIDAGTPKLVLRDY